MPNNRGTQPGAIQMTNNRSTQWNNAKRAVTRAQRGGNAHAVLDACDSAYHLFEQVGFPDDWSYIQRAADDAMFGARIYM